MLLQLQRLVEVGLGAGVDGQHPRLLDELLQVALPQLLVQLLQLILPLLSEGTVGLDSHRREGRWGGDDQY